MTREEMYEKLDALYDQIDKTKVRAEMAKNETLEKLDDEMAETRGNVAAAKESIRLADEKNRSKLSAQMLKLQMDLEQARDERAAAKLEHDRKKALKATEAMEDYASDAIAMALLAVDEAAYASLDAIEARMNYEDVFGADEPQDGKDE